MRLIQDNRGIPPSPIRTPLRHMLHIALPSITLPTSMAPALTIHRRRVYLILDYLRRPHFRPRFLLRNVPEAVGLVEGECPSRTPMKSLVVGNTASSPNPSMAGQENACKLSKENEKERKRQQMSLTMPFERIEGALQGKLPGDGHLGLPTAKKGMYHGEDLLAVDSRISILSVLARCFSCIALEKQRAALMFRRIYTHTVKVVSKMDPHSIPRIRSDVRTPFFVLDCVRFPTPSTGTRNWRASSRATKNHGKVLLHHGTGSPAYADLMQTISSSTSATAIGREET